jgi:amidophosphoribosyltransferase
LKENKKEDLLQSVYEKCKASESKPATEVQNHVKELYAVYTTEEISAKISEIVRPKQIFADVQVIFQTVENLHVACPKNLGDWYFTGDYPTPGGNKVANKAFVNFMEGKSGRAY